MAVIDDLEQIAALVSVECFWAPVVEDEQVYRSQTSLSRAYGHPLDAWRAPLEAHGLSPLLIEEIKRTVG